MPLSRDIVGWFLCHLNGKAIRNSDFAIFMHYSTIRSWLQEKEMNAYCWHTSHNEDCKIDESFSGESLETKGLVFRI